MRHDDVTADNLEDEEDGEDGEGEKPDPDLEDGHPQPAEQLLLSEQHLPYCSLLLPTLRRSSHQSILDLWGESFMTDTTATSPSLTPQT